MELESRIAYGPVWSRRFGWDAGINLLPTERKLCTLDCLYCQYGYTPPLKNERFSFPLVSDVIREWESILEVSNRLGLAVRHTTFSGNGEPTMHPQFAELADRFIQSRNEHHPEIRLAAFSNGYRLHDPAIRHALLLFDEPVLKLDCVIPEKFQQLNRPCVPFALDDYIEILKQCKNVMIQTMFIHGWNDTSEDLNAWKNALKEIRPRFVQIYSVERDTALPGLRPLSRRQLIRIAAEATHALNLPVRAYC